MSLIDTSKIGDLLVKNPKYPFWAVSSRCIYEQNSNENGDYPVAETVKRDEPTFFYTESNSRQKGGHPSLGNSTTGSNFR